MSKVELSPEDIKLIKAQQDNSPIVRFLRTKDQLKFTVGDFLVKLHKHGEVWEPETISSVSDQPKRFLCIHEDEYGIKYIRPLTSFGKELPTIMQLTETSEYTKYEMDPEYAEHIILSDGEEFDFSEKRKQDKAHRDNISRKNKKISIRYFQLEDIDSLLEGLKPGDKFWSGYTIPECATSAPLIFVGLRQEKLYHQSQYTPVPRTQTYIAEFKHSDATLKSPIYYIKSEDLIGRTIMLTEPFKYETV